MTIRKQILLIVGLAIIIFVTMTYVLSRLTLMNDLLDVEKTHVQQHVEQALNAISYSLHDLERSNADWASWDDTYAFIEDENGADYIASNLVNETFAILDINMMVFIHSSGRIVFSKAVDLDRQEEMTISDSLRIFLEERSRNLVEKPTSGFLLFDEGPMLLSSQPILRSDDTGPSRGTLVFGRYFDARQISNISHWLGYPIDIIAVSDARMNIDTQSVLAHLSDGNSVFVQQISDQHVSGYSLIKDINNSPALVLRVNVTRDIFQSGQNSIFLLTLYILGSTLLIGGACVFLLQKRVLSRLSVITENVNRIRQTGDTATPIPVEGSDELSIMADTINNMIASLRWSYEQVKESEQHLKEELERRIQFTRALVHELKTPITPVIASSELLLEEVQEGPLLRIARNINQGASYLSQRIDELVDLARSEIGTLEIRKDRFELMPFLEEVYANTKPLTERSGQHLEIELSASLGTVYADKERIRQVILNLLNNAFKFTPSGGKIVLRAMRETSNIIIQVEDNGRGMSQTEMETLFRPYYRTEDDRARLSGLGLGLYLSKNFVELHGGHIWVESKKGKGSKFSFSIPADGDQQADSQ